MATWSDNTIEPRLIDEYLSMTDWEAVVGQYVGIVQRTVYRRSSLYTSGNRLSAADGSPFLIRPKFLDGSFMLTQILQLPRGCIDRKVVGRLTSSKHRPACRRIPSSHGREDGRARGPGGLWYRGCSDDMTAW